MSLTPSQEYITDELFIRTADENYIAARWCAINRLHTDFAWLAVHALEKYLKAVLLYNGMSTKTQGHDIVRLYGEAKLFVGQWLDEMVFAVRRLVCQLDRPILRKLPTDTATIVPTHGEMLSKQADYRPSLGMPLDDLIRSKSDDPMRFAALNLNLSFAPDFAHEAMRGGDSSRNPAIRMQVLDPMERADRKQVEDGIATARWLLSNVRLPGEDRNGSPKAAVAKQINDAIFEAERKLKLIDSPSAID